MRLTVFTAYYHLHAFALSPRVIHQRDGDGARGTKREKKEMKERRANLRRFREGKITLARSRRVGVRRISQTGR